MVSLGGRNRVVRDLVAFTLVAPGPVADGIGEMFATDGNVRGWKVRASSLSGVGNRQLSVETVICNLPTECTQGTALRRRAVRTAGCKSPASPGRFHVCTGMERSKA